MPKGLALALADEAKWRTEIANAFAERQYGGVGQERTQEHAVTSFDVVAILFCIVTFLGSAWMVPKVWRGEFGAEIPNAAVALRKRFQVPDVALVVGRIVPSICAYMFVGLVMAVAQAVEKATADSVGGVTTQIAAIVQFVCLPILALGTPFFVLVATTGWPAFVIPPPYRRIKQTRG